MGRVGPWRRPPSCYDEDEEANADSFFIFHLLDRDSNAYLDLKELTEARAVLIDSLTGDDNLSDAGVVGGMLDSMDENNDARIREEEWHDFTRAVYELVGRRRFRQLLTAWRKSLLAKARPSSVNVKGLGLRPRDDERFVVEGIPRLGDNVAGEGGRMTSPTGQAPRAEMSPEQAAMRIQASVRGRQGRNQLAKVGPRGPGTAARRLGVHDPERAKEASAAGRHLITVVSGSAGHGARARFYMDGKIIAVTKAHGDNGSGLVVVTINPATCEVVSRKCYEVFPPNLKAECARLADDVASLPIGHFVLVANKGHGLQHLNRAAVVALTSLGASFQGLGQTEVSYALIGCKGCLASDERTAVGIAQAEAMVSFDEMRRANQIRGCTSDEVAPEASCPLLVVPSGP